MDWRAAKGLASSVGLVGVLGAGAAAAMGQGLVAVGFVGLALLCAPMMFWESPFEYIERKQNEEETQAYRF